MEKKLRITNTLNKNLYRRKLDYSGAIITKETCESILDASYSRFSFYRELNGHRFIGSFLPSGNIRSKVTEWIGGDTVDDKLIDIPYNTSDMAFYIDRYYVTTANDKRIREYDINFNYKCSYMLEDTPTYMFKYQDIWFIIDTTDLNSYYKIIRYKADSDGYFNIANRLSDGYFHDIVSFKYDYKSIAAPNVILDHKNGFFYISWMKDDDVMMCDSFLLDEIIEEEFIYATNICSDFSTAPSCSPFLFDGHIFVPRVERIANINTLTGLLVYTPMIDPRKVSELVAIIEIEESPINACFGTSNGEFIWNDQNEGRIVRIELV